MLKEKFLVQSLYSPITRTGAFLSQSISQGCANDDVTTQHIYIWINMKVKCVLNGFVWHLMQQLHAQCTFIYYYFVIYQLTNVMKHIMAYLMIVIQFSDTSKILTSEVIYAL